MHAADYKCLRSISVCFFLSPVSPGFGAFLIPVGFATYRHIRNYYLSNSKTFQDGNGNGNFEKINSNDFQDGNWESMEMKGRLRGPKTVTVMVIKLIHPNFKTVTVTGILGENKFSRITRLPVIIFDSNGTRGKRQW